MNESIINEIKERALSFGGKVGIVWRDLVTGEHFEMGETTPLMAASTIKMSIMAEAERQFEAGLASRDEIYILKESDKVPSCGALTYMHEGLEITLLDLVTLMIILSDNTATNILIRRFGYEAINSFIKSRGMKETVLRREMFDYESAKKGMQNYICAADLADMLEAMYKGELVNAHASAEMLDILKKQRLNSKLPFILHSLPESIPIAHKTGEDDEITHDVGIIFGKHPFVLCICANGIDVPMFERFMQDTAYTLYQNTL
ncbi:MAG: serine hydrolase [Clostridia bacterium]|nr:serine hydrolase [Clostridia bacterium]